MAFNNSAGRNNAMAPMPPQSAPPRAGEPAGSWEEMGSQRFQPKGRRRHILPLLGILLILMLIFAGIRLSVELSGTNDQFQVRVGNQQAALVDLRQSISISPQLRGANVFPLINSQDVDQGYTASIMNYTPKMMADMQKMNLGLLRFPGGEKGEQTIVSFTQLDQFAKMLNDTHAEGMVQVHLGGPTAKNNPQNVTNDPTTRAALAASWVDFINHQTSANRTPVMKDFHPIKYWVIGDQPDKQIDPTTNKPYTAADYASVFETFSLAMHKVDGTIKVFGPELSDFNGIGAGPRDAAGNLWMETFLKAVAGYEAQHQQDLQQNGLAYHLLDGVSFHYYPLQSNTVIPSQLMVDPSTWQYTIPQLHDSIKQIMGRDLEVSISEINTNNAPGVTSPTQGQAALWWADTLGELMNERVDAVGFFAASGVNTGYPLFTTDGLHDTALERVMETFANLQSNLVPLSISENPISIYATQDTAHANVSLLFVNKSNIPESAQIDPVNDFLGLSPWHSLSLSIGADSVIVVTLHRDGHAAEADYFQVPAQNENTLANVNHAVCGTKTDALNYSIPC